jgi:hypothetical protein
MPFHPMALRIALSDEDPEKDPSDVGVEDGGSLAEREAPDRSRGVLANAFE